MSYVSGVIAHFVPNFVAMATGSVAGKCDWQHSMAHLRKPPYRQKNLPKMFYPSRVIANFVPNFVAMAMGVGRGKMRLAAFDGPSPKNPYRRKNLVKISYASRVIAHFVPNFVAMATGVGWEKMRLAAFDGPSTKTPLQSQKSRENLLRKPSYSPFCPKFRCHGNGGRSGKNAIGSIQWPILENPPIGAKISYTSRVIAHFVANFVAMATREGPG